MMRVVASVLSALCSQSICGRLLLRQSDNICRAREHRRIALQPVSIFSSQESESLFRSSNIRRKVQLLSLLFIALSISLLCSRYASAFQLGEARFTNSFEELVIKVKVLDVQRDHNSVLTGSLHSKADVVSRFSFSVVGAGKDVDLVAQVPEQLKGTLEFVLRLEFEDAVSTRRYQINASSSEPLDGSIEVTEQLLKTLPVASSLELTMDSTVYVVSEGQTLWDVSADTASLNGNNFQRALAIYATNRHQFTDGDINQLDRRTVLWLPSQLYVNSFDPERSATVFFGIASGQLMIDAFLESAERIATSSSIEIPTEQMILARRVKFLEQQLEEVDEKYQNRLRRLDQKIDRRLRDLENAN